MKRKDADIDHPALGCKIGRAYQILLGGLSTALRNAGLDISTNEYLILRALYSKDDIQQCEISDMTGKDKATVCRCVSALEKRGYVSTESISHKCLKVRLTEKARSIEPDIIAVAEKRHLEFETLISPENVEIFTSVLDMIINSKSI